eukprot:jgi/Botrbrau1/4587/Bobra.60_2s0073.1
MTETAMNARLLGCGFAFEGRSLIVNSKVAIQKMAVHLATPSYQVVARGLPPARFAANHAECRATASLLMCCSRQSQFPKLGLYSSAMALTGGWPAMQLHGPCSSGSQSRRNFATRAASGASGEGKRINMKDYTEKAWQAIVQSPELARESQNQIVETEHLMKALLEQPNGLARRIISKAGGDPSDILEKVNNYIGRQPRVSGESGQVLGRNLEAAVTKAESLKKEMGDEFVSVEHLLLALAEDSRVLAQLLRSVGLDAAKLEAATKEIRGSNRVTDQDPEGKYEALSRFART